MLFKHKLSRRFALMRYSLSVITAAAAILSCKVNGTAGPPPPPPPPGTVLASEGFEDGNLGSRGWFDATTVATAADTRPGSTGTRVLQWHWTVGSTAPQGTSRITFTPSSSVYVSYWIKMSCELGRIRTTTPPPYVWVPDHGGRSLDWTVPYPPDNL